jgi:hypothetical protein
LLAGSWGVAGLRGRCGTSLQQSPSKRTCQCLLHVCAAEALELLLQVGHVLLQLKQLPSAAGCRGQPTRCHSDRVAAKQRRVACANAVSEHCVATKMGSCGMPGTLRASASTGRGHAHRSHLSVLPPLLFMMMPSSL